MAKLDMRVMKNVLAKSFKPLINSRDYALYSDQLNLITSDIGLANANVNEYERRVEGQSGVYWDRRTGRRGSTVAPQHRVGKCRGPVRRGYGGGMDKRG